MGSSSVNHNPRVRVLLADDHPLYRSALSNAVKRRPELELIGESDDGEKALDQIRRLEPDVAVLDVRMPGIDGPQVLNAVIRDSIPTRTLFVSASTKGALVYELISAGANGYVDKGANANEICEAIVAVSRGSTVLSDAVEGEVLDQLRGRAITTRPELSPREREVLALIADGMSAPSIGSHLFIEASTVRTHMENLYEKLGVSERAAAVAEGMRRGLLE